MCYIFYRGLYGSRLSLWMLAWQATALRQLRNKSNGYYTVQSHSRSPILVWRWPHGRISTCMGIMHVQLRWIEFRLALVSTKCSVQLINEAWWWWKVRNLASIFDACCLAGNLVLKRSNNRKLNTFIGNADDWPNYWLQMQLPISAYYWHPISHRFPIIAEYWSNYRCRQGVLLFNAIVMSEALNSRLRNLASRNYRHQFFADVKHISISRTL